MHTSARVGRFLASSETAATKQNTDRILLAFGWVGAKDRALQRYAAVFHEAGCATVLRHTAKTSDVFLKEKELVKTAEETLDLLQREYPGKPATLVYFSNGGCFIHEKLSLLWKEDLKRPLAERRWKDARLAGFIYDSCPAYLSLTAGTRALVGSIKNDVLRACAFAATYLFFSVFIPLFWGFSRPKQYFHNLTTDPFTTTPALYIYSDTDVITCPKELSKFIQARREYVAQANPNAGASAASDAPAIIQEWRIPATVKSPHVSHLIAQPEEYSRRVKDFITQLR